MRKRLLALLVALVSLALRVLSDLSVCFCLDDIILFIDNSHQIVKHLRVHVIKFEFEIILLLLAEDVDDAGRHLPDFLVDAHEVRVGQVRSLAVYHVHLLDLAEQGRDEQVVALVNLAKVDEDKEDYILEDAVLLAEVPLLEHFENLFDQLVDLVEYREQLLYLQGLRVVQ